MAGVQTWKGNANLEGVLQPVVPQLNCDGLVVRINIITTCNQQHHHLDRDLDSCSLS